MRPTLTALLLACALGAGAGCVSTGDQPPRPPTHGGEPVGGEPGAGKPKRSGIFGIGGKPRDADGPTMAEMELGVQTLETLVPDEYKVGVGDTIVVTLTGVPEDDQYKLDDIVGAGGKISLPYIGELRVVGRTERDIESEILNAYIPRYYRRANVSVLVPKTYSVSGEVNKPGKFSLRGHVTLLHAIAEAGGVREYAHPRTVYIFRNEQRFPFDRKKIEANPRLNVDIKPGDIVKVPEWFF